MEQFRARFINIFRSKKYPEFLFRVITCISAHPTPKALTNMTVGTSTGIDWRTLSFSLLRRNSLEQSVVQSSITLKLIPPMNENTAYSDRACKATHVSWIKKGHKNQSYFFKLLFYKSINSWIKCVLKRDWATKIFFFIKNNSDLKHSHNSY